MVLKANSLSLTKQPLQTRINSFIGTAGLLVFFFKLDPLGAIEFKLCKSTVELKSSPSSIPFEPSMIPVKTSSENVMSISLRTCIWDQGKMETNILASGNFSMATVADEKSEGIARIEI
ncbi:unnamed protein product [Ambrosiozyma monospora]|uniref:Unnamed protein product n=1 Tax=Ambrosiozyma monospora TaxID=43982 RepID=A0ACB5U7I9_AMBMO|nr:unnamed protein product [Ambrosiozyma monospora]